MTGLEPLVLVALAGTAVSAIGQIQAGNAAKRAGEFNAAVSQRNATITRNKAAADAARQDREARLRAGTNRAVIGGMGVTLEGSPLDVLEDNAAQEELERLNILHAGDLRASGFETDAQIEIMRGKQAQKSSRMAAAGTLISGVATSGFGSSTSPGLTSAPRGPSLSPGASIARFGR